MIDEEKKKDETYHSPIDPSVRRCIKEAIVDARDKAAPDEADNTNIIQLIANAVHARRMIANSMIRSRHTQTGYRTRKIASKYSYIFSSSKFISRMEKIVQTETAKYSSDSAKKMSVNVYSLVVDIAETGKGSLVAVRRRSVAGGYVLVVLLP